MAYSLPPKGTALIGERFLVARPYSGGQAEYLHVPYADFNAPALGPDAGERQFDYVMLSDIFPAGWHAGSPAL